MDETSLRRRLARLADRVNIEEPLLQPIRERGRWRRVVWLAGVSVSLCILVAGVALPLAGLTPLTKGHFPNVMESPPSDITRIGGPGVTLIDVGGEPGPMAVGEGGVWVLRQRRGHVQQVLEIDPGTNKLSGTPIAISIQRGAEIYDLAAGEGGVWALVLRPGPGGTWDVPGEVLRIDPATRAVVAEIDVGRHPLALAAGLGAVWVSNTTDGTVSRIDPALNRVVDTIPVGKGPEKSPRAWGRCGLRTASTGRTSCASIRRRTESSRPSMTSFAQFPPRGTSGWRDPGSRTGESCGSIRPPTGWSAPFTAWTSSRHSPLAGTAWRGSPSGSTTPIEHRRRGRSVRSDLHTSCSGCFGWIRRRCARSASP
jgi:YVTN family beta-propeller protein